MDMCVGPHDHHTPSGVKCNVCGKRLDGSESPSRLDDGRVARYTDDSLVQAGDQIRYRQTPGGILAADRDWTYGIAALYPHSEASVEQMTSFNKTQGYTALDPNELHLMHERPMGGYSTDTRTEYLYIVGHIVERVT